MRRGFTVAFCLSLWFCIPMYSQVGDTRILELRDSVSIANEKRRGRVEDYLARNSLQLFETKNGVTRMLYDVSSKNMPIFLKTDNIGAAITTGADELQEGGDSGLNLNGEGVSIAVWDGGKVRETHQELIGRINVSDGGAVNNFHATHVTGTILATGITANAKGMANKARAFTFDFQDDDAEMANRIRPDQSGIILSNHSYGLITGWNDGTWYGDASISESEDYRFGFYTGGARLWDEYAYNSPYYTIVKSAGNDRGDSGDGSHPADGPYDIISSEATAKNIITIGAVSKVPDYTNPGDVQMSSFSSWGPTDDGRIKPDFVAAGVSLFSTFETADDAYGSLNGTSMSTPNATGSFVLLQQLHARLKGGNFMKSAKLKGLIAHTIKEAGLSDGPDYRFGWGLIDVSAASDFLIKENGSSKLIKELEIGNNESFELEFSPEIGSKVTATLCWTDVPGSTPAAQLDPEDIILINDLDMRVENTESQDIHEPWILDPDNPGGNATTGDNFRDNIEKIEFIAQNSSYSLSINPKHELATSSQTAFLFLSYEKVSEPEKFYWIGGNSGEWNNISNWSETSGGNQLDKIPESNSVVVFDFNSFDTDDDVNITLTGDVTIGSIKWMVDYNANVNLNSFDLNLEGQYSANDNLIFLGEGRVIFSGDGSVGSKEIAPRSSFANTTVLFDDQNTNWVFLGDSEFGSIELISGSLDISEQSIKCDEFLISSSEFEKHLNMTDAIVTVSTKIDFTGSLLSFTNNEASQIVVPINDEAIIDSEFAFNGSLLVNGAAELIGNADWFNVKNQGSLQINDDKYVNTLDLDGNSSLNLVDGVSLELNQIVASNNSEVKRINISSEGTASLILNGHQKICHEYFDVSNVNLLGEASVSLGESSTLSTSSGWSLLSCENVLFADFTPLYLCEGSLTLFNDKSTGNIVSYTWKVNDEFVSDLENPYYKFPASGVYEIQLEIEDESSQKSYTRQIEIGENSSVTHPSIIENSSSLAVLQSAESYQWFRDDLPIVGETSRSLIHNNIQGVYRVIAINGDCNLVSDTYELAILGTEDKLKINLYPNPVDEVFTVEGIGDLSHKLSDISGRHIEVKCIKVDKQTYNFYVGKLTSGIYYLSINDGISTKTIKILKK